MDARMKTNWTLLTATSMLIFACAGMFGQSADTLTVVAEQPDSLEVILQAILEHIENRPKDNSVKTWLGWIAAGLMLAYNVVNWFFVKLKDEL